MESEMARFRQSTRQNMLQPAGRQANDDDRERAYYENNVGLLEEALSVAMSKTMTSVSL